MITLTKKQIKEALPKIKKGLERYLWIQNEILKIDVSADEKFQRKFNSFYGITPHRNKDWQKDFYSLLQKSKNTDLSFETILLTLHKKTGRVEASFASKLKATISTEMPVIDSFVLKNLKLRLPYSYQKDREEKISIIYKKIIIEFSDFLKTENGVYLVNEFNMAYHNTKISETKMLDFILWQTRI